MAARAYRYCTAAANPEDENAGIEVVFQMEHGSLRNTVMIDLLAHVMKDPFFDQLRTKQQLGYLVFSGARLDFTVSSLRFILQVRAAVCVCADACLCVCVLHAAVNGVMKFAIIMFIFSLGHRAHAQSPKVTADELDRRIEVFIESFRTVLSAMTDDDFDHNKAAGMALPFDM